MKRCCSLLSTCLTLISLVLSLLFPLSIIFNSQLLANAGQFVSTSVSISEPSGTADYEGAGVVAISPPESTAGSSIPENVPTQNNPGNIVAHWKFEETSGLILDETVNNHDGIYNGTLYHQPGKAGYSLGFDGINDYVSVSYSSDFYFSTTDFTVAFWMYPLTDGAPYGTPGQQYLIGRSYAGNHALGWDLRYGYSGPNRVEVVGVASWGFNITSPAIVTENNWHFIVLTGTSTTGTLYINGAFVGTCGRRNMPDSPTPLEMGFPTGISTADFNGYLDEVMIWKGIALSAAEVQQLYQEGLGPQVKDEKGYPQNDSLPAYDPAHPCGNPSEPVNITNGALTKIERDIYITGRGLPVYIERAYNSRSDCNSSFGYGWTYNYNTVLKEQSNSDVTWIDEDGSELLFDENNGIYSPASGTYAVLTKTGNIFTLTQKHGTRYVFEDKDSDTGDYELSRIEDPNGNAVLLDYTNGFLTKVTEPSGRELNFTYSGSLITAITDPANRVVSYSYDTEGNLVSVIDPENNETAYAYTDHNITTATDPEGHQWHWFYNEEDRCIRQTDDLDREMTFSYDFDSLTSVLTDERGNATTYLFNTNGFIDRITDAYGHTTTYTWDENLNRTGITDNNGNTTTFRYNTKGNLIETQDALGYITSYTYEPVYNLVASVTDEKGNTASYNYDPNGNLTQTTDALGNETSYTYDTRGQMKTMTDAKGNTTYFNYDTYGNLTKITDAEGSPTDFVYDIVGNNISITNANNNTTGFSYDKLSRLTKITYPDNTIASYSYDRNDNLISYTDPNNNTTTYAYDKFNQLAGVTDALGENTRYTYDEAGNQITVTDAQGNVTSYTYDKVHRLIRITTPLGNQTNFTYDAVGNQKTVTDANGHTATYGYDKLDQLKLITYADNSAVSYDYDPAGNCIGMSDRRGTTIYEYDNLNQLIQIDGPGNNNTIAYKYNTVGNRIRMTNHDGGMITYDYDKLNRLKKITDPWGRNTSYNYDNVSNLIEMNYPNNTQANYAFDKLNRLITLSNKKTVLETAPTINPFATKNYRPAETIISSCAYKYDPAGRRIKTVLANGDYIDYAYDKADRLTSETKTKWNEHRQYYTYQYEFDQAGNRTALSRELHQKPLFAQGRPDEEKTKPSFWDLPGLTNFSYSYDKENKLLQVKADRGGTVYIADYEYDYNGNLIKKTEYREAEPQKKEITAYSYNYEDQLILITYPDGSTDAYTYDGEGRRIQTVETEIIEKGRHQQTKTKITKYLYDGNSVIIEREAAINQTTGLPTGAETTTATYARGLSYDGGIGGIISCVRPADVIYYHYDGNGNVTELTDAAGEVIQTYEYEAYGNLLSSNGTIVNPYQFSTKEFSSRRGLSYFGARYYDPRIGRWTQPDPLGMVAGPNMYLYCANDPVNNSDPWGELSYRWRSLKTKTYKYKIIKTSTKSRNISGGKTNQKTGGCKALATSIDAFRRTLTESLQAGKSFWGEAFKSGVTWGTQTGSLAEQAGRYGGKGWQYTTQFFSGTATVAGLTAGGLMLAEATGISNLGSSKINILSKGNILKIVNRAERWGYRIDPAHHGKPWGHSKFWRW